MKRVEPITIDVSKPYPPWQFRSKRALQYEIGKNSKVELVEVRPTMVYKKSLLGWSYKFRATVLGPETALKDVILSILCLFEHGPIVVYEKSFYDDKNVPERCRVLIRGKNSWWELNKNERIGKFHITGNRETGTIEKIAFHIIDKSGHKPDKLHTTTRKLPSVEF